MQAGIDTDSEADSAGGASAAEAAATAVGAGLVYVCRTCGITTTSPENLQAHFDGAQHKCVLRVPDHYPAAIVAASGPASLGKQTDVGRNDTL